ncbi:MAG: 3-hydroxyacyl-CoA dehydrogenase [Methylococcales bacterium]
MEIKNKNFLITGGSSGLGEGTVRALIELGANVIIADLNEEKGTDLTNELGDKSRFVKVDVCDEISTQTAIDMVTTEFGGLHGVVNCAGIVVGQKVLDRDGNPFPLELFRAGVEVNLIGTFNVSRLASKVMTENEPDSGGERGVIINTASVAAFEGQIGQASYSASKAGVTGMTLPIARELARHGIRVMTIAPGLFETPMLASLPEEVLESLGQQVPFPPRLGRAEEYAMLAISIFENPMLNGETIRLDGAIRMGAK